MFVSTGIAELLFLGVLTLIAMAIIIFLVEDSFLFIGPLLLGLILSIPYLNDENHLSQEFVLKRFKEGKSIECGLFRGEMTLVNPNAGWNYLPGTGFIKDDRIHNDLGLCSVMGEEAPVPSAVPYMFIFIFELMACFGMRYTMGSGSNTQQQGDRHDNG